MLFSYVLYPFKAEKYHTRFDITPSTAIDVGFLGHKLYTAKITNLNVIQILSKRSAQPVYSFIEKPAPVSVEKLIDILIGYFLGMTEHLVKFETIEYTDCILFYPIFDGNYVYASGNEFVFLKDLSPYIGRCYLSFSKFALECEKRYPRFPDVIEDNGIVTYDEILDLYANPSEVALRKMELRSIVQTQLEDGYVSIPSQDKRSTILIEFSEIWNLRRKIDPSSVTVYGSEEDPMQRSYKVVRDNMQKYVQELEGLSVIPEVHPARLTGCDFNFWITESLHRIQSGQTPLLRIFSEERIDIMSLYKKMIENNPILAKVESDLHFTKTGENEGFYYIPILGPEDLLLALELIKSIDKVFDFRNIPEVKPNNIINDSVIWTVQTEDGNVYEITDKEGLGAEELNRRWEDGYYTSPWALYVLEKMSVDSAMFLKPNL
jgi:hypothetical protein